MISTLAHIHPDATIGNNVTIDPFAVIEGNVIIGDGTHIMSHTSIKNGSRIGKHCKIFPGAVIGGLPQDLKYEGEETTAEIGDYTTIRECVTVNLGTKDKWKTVIGSHCLLMAYTHVAHDCMVGNNVIMANGVQLAGHVIVDDYATIGGLAGIHQFVHIGAHTYLAGHAIIRKDVPPYIKGARDPMSYVGVNIVGLTRRGYSKETIEEISNIYHILFVEKHTISAALGLIEKKFLPSPVKDEIIEFVRNSKTGIIKRSSKTASDESISI